MAIYPPPTRKTGWQYWNANLTHSFLAGGATTNVTASNLYQLAVEGKLNRGTRYRITDYRSVNWLNGFYYANDTYKGYITPTIFPAGTVMYPGRYKNTSGNGIIPIDQYKSNDGTYIARQQFSNNLIRFTNKGSFFSVKQLPVLLNTVTYAGCISKELPDGSFFVGGTITPGPFGIIQKITSSFEAYPGFTNLETDNGGGFAREIQKILLLSDGSVLVCGRFSAIEGIPCGSIFKMDVNGNPDTAFNTNVSIGFMFGSDVAVIVDAVETPDGSIILVGTFNKFNGNSIGESICKLNSDGTIDYSFSTAIGLGLIGGSIAGSGQIIPRIKYDSVSDSYLICGDFTSLNSIPRSSLVRILSNGAVPPSWTGASFNDAVNSVEILPDSTLVVVGKFTTVDSNAYLRACKLNSNGTVNTSDQLTGQLFNNATSVNWSAYDSETDTVICSGSFLEFDTNPLPGFASFKATSGSIPGLDGLQVHTSPNPEVIVVTALSQNRFEAVGYSETYGDIVEFNPICNSIGIPIDIYNGATLPDSTVVSGFDLQWDGRNAYFTMPEGYPVNFGHIFLIYMSLGSASYDTSYENSIILPGENNNLTASTNLSKVIISNDGKKVTIVGMPEDLFLEYIPGSLSVTIVNPIEPAYGWMLKRTDPINNVTAPLDWRNFRYRRWQFLATGSPFTYLTDYRSYFGSYGAEWYFYPTVTSTITTGDYVDYPVLPVSLDVSEFDPILNALYSYYVTSVIINGSSGTTTYWGTVSNQVENVVMVNIELVNIELYEFYNNTILDYVYASNITGESLTFSVIQAMDSSELFFTVNNAYFDGNKNIVYCSGHLQGYNFSSLWSGYSLKSIVFSTAEFNNATITTPEFEDSYSKRLILGNDNNTYLEYFDGTTLQYIAI
jgi:hypothetical protein